MMLLYSLVLLIVFLVTAPYWLLRMAWSGRYRHGLDQRLGRISPALQNFIAGRRTIWVHAVSVGEVIAAGRLIEMLQSLNPEIPIVVSTTTESGQKLAQSRYSAGQPTKARVFYYPMDFAWIVRRYLRALRPCAIVLMESELWPRMLVETKDADIPVIVVNGRISNRSWPRYRALKRLWRPLFHKLARVLAQSEEDRDRFRELGAPPGAIQIAGNLKYDVRVAAESDLTREMLAHLPQHPMVIVAGSTLEGEEQLLLNAFRELLSELPELRLVLAPRRPERFRAVERLVEATNFLLLRRSDWMLQPKPIPPGSVFLLDSIGDLASVYSIASTAFVGGSMIPWGGHNPLEPAQFAVPIVMGPHIANFRAMVAILLDREGIRVTPPERLASVLHELLTSPSAQQMGKRARCVFEEQAGASQKSFVAIQSILVERGDLKRT